MAVFQGCGYRTDVKNDPLYPEGERLSEVYCISCHLHTTPEVLDRISWEKVLLIMKDELQHSGVSLTEEEWLKIQQYYIRNAPAQLAEPEIKQPITKRAAWTITNPLPVEFDHAPYITAINWDPGSQSLYVGDLRGRLVTYKQMKPVDSYQLKNIPIQASFSTVHNRLEVLGIGSFMPSEHRTGQLIAIDSDGISQVIIDSLQRPVHFLDVDLEGDGQKEYLISSFGSTEGVFNSGRLSLFAKEQDQYLEKVIRQSPGAIKSAVIDHNNDGLLDIIALFAQGREGLYLFTNQGHHQFEERLIQEFLPVHGSNDFELVDINSDTFPDLVMTNGDNGDSSPVFKYYHGVRIFLNNGSYGFEESYFYPLNGASRVICRDFDLDNDIDFVVLSMYPDLIRWKNEALVYFENTGNSSFDPQYLVDEPVGRWIVMDAGDMDLDGYPDLVLGSNMRIRGVLTPPRILQGWQEKPHAIYLFKKQP